MLDHRALREEKQTWHYIYRLVLRMYKHTYQYQQAHDDKKEMPVLEEPIAGGWEQQKVCVCVCLSVCV